jgi:hypothetical protein
MTQLSESRPALLLFATGPLFACATSVFAALGISAVLLICTLCAAAATRFTAHAFPRAQFGASLVSATAVSATVAGALLVTLIVLGFSDIVAAFGAQIILAALAAALFGNKERGNEKKPVRSAANASAQIAAVGVACELIGHGTLLGDYELAFAGTTHGWLLHTGLPPLSLLATPAGALVVAALVLATTALLRSRAPMRNDAPTITEPRNGRRVRVTGHIS